MFCWAAPLLVVGLAACAGCGGTGTGDGSTVASSCSDSGFTDAVSPRLAALASATLRVDAGHGDTKILGAAAPGLLSAANSVHVAAKGNKPCRPGLVKARAQLLAATSRLSGAGRALELLGAAASKGTDYSGFQRQFPDDWFAGTPNFQHALASLRVAGVPGLVSATDGKGVFTEAGCATCHTLAAAGATGTAGPNLDVDKPSKSTVGLTVTNGQGVMLSFQGTLSAAQIRAVAAFVNQNSGKYRTRPLPPSQGAEIRARDL